MNKIKKNSLTTSWIQSLIYSFTDKILPIFTDKTPTQRISPDCRSFCSTDPFTTRSFEKCSFPQHQKRKKNPPAPRFPLAHHNHVNQSEGTAYAAIVKKRASPLSLQFYLIDERGCVYTYGETLAPPASAATPRANDKAASPRRHPLARGEHFPREGFYLITDQWSSRARPPRIAPVMRARRENNKRLCRCPHACSVRPAAGEFDWEINK